MLIVVQLVRVHNEALKIRDNYDTRSIASDLASTNQLQKIVFLDNKNELGVIANATLAGCPLGVSTLSVILCVDIGEVVYSHLMAKEKLSPCFLALYLDAPGRCNVDRIIIRPFPSWCNNLSLFHFLQLL